jgi:hypothetical protein
LISLRKNTWWVGVFLGAFGVSVAACQPGQPGVLLQEGFDADLDTGLAAALLKDPEIRLAPGQGPDGSDAIQVDYVGYERGSHRVTCVFKLAGAADTATLSFDVRFDEGFQFVRGGKLHGLSPKIPVSGGQKRIPQGWSARISFLKDGYVGSYLYDQNPDKKWGIGGHSTEQVFFPGCWHHVDFQIHLNDPGQANGWSRVFVDGHEVQKSTGVAYREIGGTDTLIQKFLFSTFHGGSTPDWAPVDDQGEFTTIHAWFDNFRVVEGYQKIEPVSCRDN